MGELSMAESNQMRSLGRDTARKVAAIAREAAMEVGMSRDFATVTKVNQDGTVEVNFGSPSHEMSVGAVRTTVDCASANVGDVVVVDTYAHVPLVTGIVSSGANSPWNWISGKIDHSVSQSLRDPTNAIADDLNTCGPGVFLYNIDTANRPNDYGMCVSFVVQEGNWVFQLALPTAGDPHWRRNINNAGWEGWWTATTA